MPVDFRLDTCWLGTAPCVNFAVLLPQFPQQLDRPSTAHDDQCFLCCHLLDWHIRQEDRPLANLQSALARFLGFLLALSSFDCTLITLRSTGLYPFAPRWSIHFVIRLHPPLFRRADGWQSIGRGFRSRRPAWIWTSTTFSS